MTAEPFKSILSSWESPATSAIRDPNRRPRNHQTADFRGLSVVKVWQLHSLSPALFFVKTILFWASVEMVYFAPRKLLHKHTKTCFTPNLSFFFSGPSKTKHIPWSSSYFKKNWLLREKNAEPHKIKQNLLHVGQTSIWQNHWSCDHFSCKLFSYPCAQTMCWYVQWDLHFY